MDGLALAPVEAVKAGTVLIADGGFTCLCEHETVTVEADEVGELFVRCAGPDEGENAEADHGKPATSKRCERHGLDGQLDDAGKNYVGFWIAP